MQWKEEYSIGIPEIDADHRRLADCLTEIEQAVAEGGRGAIVHFALAQLISISSVHFDIEESLMKIQRYPQVDDHTAGHGAFLQRLETIEENFLAEPLSSESVQFLKVWLEEHFTAEDKDYASYLSQRDGTLDRDD